MEDLLLGRVPVSEPVGEQVFDRTSPVAGAALGGAAHLRRLDRGAVAARAEPRLVCGRGVQVAVVVRGHVGIIFPSLV